jgi:hypothetical protein
MPRKFRLQRHGAPRLHGLVALLVFFILPITARAQQIHRNSFETGTPVWVKGTSDSQYDVKEHASTDRVAHEGRRSEYLSLDIKAGTTLHYQYVVGKAPIGEELFASVYLKANRPDLQIMARVVLPNERDPNNLEYRLTTYLRGDTYTKVGQWQQLRIGRPMQLAKQQQQLMQAQLKRAVNFADAYIEALVVNVNAGPGPTEVWFDDLEIGPLAPEAAFQPQPAKNAKGVVDAKPTSLTHPNRKKPPVEYSGNNLLVGKQRFFIRGIRWSDTPLRIWKDAGFNTIFFDTDVPDSVLKEAADLDLWIVPELRAFELGPDGRSLVTVAPEQVARQTARFLGNESVLMYRLNGIGKAENAQAVGRIVQAVRNADPGRPVAGDVWDGLLPFSRSYNLVALHRNPLMTTLELPKYREWLDGRRNLANPGAFLWTWVQTDMPEKISEGLYERSAKGSFNEPVGPQPEQVRLLAYSAIASGCRGLAFASDRFLADSHQGRDRLMSCALVNQELEMLEPLLLNVDDPPEWIETSVPEIKAAVIRSAKGVLVMPMWQGKFAQLVPGQAAATKLTFVVPQVPQTMSAWEVTPADVHSLKSERAGVVGGTRVTLQEFGLTATIVFTSDTTLVGRFQEQARSSRQLASQWTYDMALYEMEKVVRVHEQLAASGNDLPGGTAKPLIQDAQNRLRTSHLYWQKREFAQAYHESQRALRPIRVLMRAHWEQAVRGLDSPTTSPYAVTFYTLPKHYEFMDKVKRNAPTASVLVDGDFEVVAGRQGSAWTLATNSLDDLDLIAERVGESSNVRPVSTTVPVPSAIQPKEGRQCAMLQTKPKTGKPAPFTLERTMVTLESGKAQVQPGALVKISVWVNLPAAVTGSVDGVLFYDSAAGEPFAIRLTEATTGWKQLTLYRKAPESGQISVTLQMTGLGTAYFDDVRIEPMLPNNNNAAPPR